MSDDSNSDSFGYVAPTEPFLRGTDPVGDIIMAILFFGVGCLHLWRNSQTNNSCHVIMTGAVLFAIISFGMRIDGAYNFKIIVFNYSWSVLAVSGWIIKVTVAYLGLAWSRSMGKAITQRAQLVHRFSIGGIFIYNIGITLVISGWLVYFHSTTLSAFNATPTLIKFGYGITLAFNLPSAGLFIWQFFETKNDSIPGLSAKRKQLLVLTAHCILIFIADMFYLLELVRANHVFHVLVLCVGVYTRKALTGFDKEPDLTSCMPIVIPTVAYGQQTVNMAVNPSMVFMQPVHMEHPVVYQHHVGTEEANATTPAIYTNVQAANSSESDTLSFSDNHAFVVEDPASNPNPNAAPYPQE
ncbi:hypothetical protein BDF19DRAFT_417318 [Syncephalis fuscata]|nr:hypothetical protein BDF19DRAFT_417318 [Syncephalis fuscata]